MNDVSVVICAYTDKRWRELVSAVESVQQQSFPPEEIIVVIDHNPDLLKRVQLQIPAVVVIENKEQRGLSGARNSGIAAAQGEVIAFMDEDAVSATDWLAQLSAGYEDHRVLGVGGAIEPLWPENRPSWFPEEFDWVVGCTYRGMPQGPAAVRNLIGCNMSFRREVFETVGRFRGGLGRIGIHPVGCEETELCIRAQQYWSQGVLRYEPRARVYHRVPANRTDFRYFSSRCYFEGRSKAIVASLVGNRDSLASEWTYTLQTLPKGIYQNLQDAIRYRKKSGLAKAGAIMSGFTITTAGYLVGTLSGRLKVSRSPKSYVGGPYV